MNCASIYVFSVYVGHMYVQDWLPNYVSSMCSLHVYAFKISVGQSEHSLWLDENTYTTRKCEV